MATFCAIPEKTQNRTAMKRVLNYVMQDHKTMYNGVKLVSGQNCIPQTAYSEFMATKNQYRKANGVFFKQYVQSFKPGTATPELIHQIGIEMAKAFDGFEVVVATHIDADHWHNHFVVNSVNCENGLKIQINEKGLEELRNKSDEICMKYGLEVLKPYTKPKQKPLGTREYRAAIKGESWKFALMAAIDNAMKYCRTKDEFIKYMKRRGYDVKWHDNYKYITYTCPNKMKCRDIRLHEEKYRKEKMELEYRLRSTEAEERTLSFTNGRSDTGYNRGKRILERIGTAEQGAIGNHTENGRQGNSQGDISGAEENIRTGWEAEREYLDNREYSEANERPLDTDIYRGNSTANIISDSLYFAGDILTLIENTKSNPNRKHYKLSRKEIEKRLAHGQKISQDDGFEQSM